MSLQTVMTSRIAVIWSWSFFSLSMMAQSEVAAPDLRFDVSSLDDRSSPRVTSYADVLEPVQRSVVAVYSARVVRERVPMNPFFREFFGDAERERRTEGLGSGVVVTPDGYILTNNHVVEGADELNVRLNDGRELSAELVGADPKTDVAVIKVDAESLPAAILTDSDELRVGDVVFAVGNPLDVGQTVTMGIVSAKGRNNLGLLGNEQGYEDFIQTDAAINMGNSGGALVDAGGRLVGINTAILSTSRGNIGIGFAIPVNMAASVMNSLVLTGTVERGFLGVSTQTIDADMEQEFGLPEGSGGAVVLTVVDDSPADQAGIENGDVIVSVNGRETKSGADLRIVVSQIMPGTEVDVVIYRDNEPQVLPITLTGFPVTGPAELLEGIIAEPVNEEIQRSLRLRADISGLVITEVESDSPYVRRFAPGMVILEINRRGVETLDDARNLLRNGRNLLLIYYRGSFSYRSLIVNER